MTESAVINEIIYDAVQRNRLENAREWLIDALRDKFGSDVVDQDVIDMINSQDTLDILRTWDRDGRNSTSWNKFLQRLRG